MSHAPTLAQSIDLNADLGEVVNGQPTADDEAMFALVTSANIATGGHAGDAASMAHASQLARQFGVAIGAHPSYEDIAHFGRTAHPHLPGRDLRDALISQLTRLHDAGAEIAYVKPHGALYNAIVHHTEHADAVVSATAVLSERWGREIGLLVLGGEVERRANAAGIRVVREAFLDRGYLADGTLVPRTERGAVLHDAALVAERAVRMVTERTVVARDGTVVPLRVGSLCVHGDTPEAVAMATAVRIALADAGVSIRSPW